MSSDSDIALAWKEHKEAMKEEKQERHTKNMDVLVESGIPFTVTNLYTVLLFREEGKPKVDFYPGTGRWRNVGVGAVTFRGGATAFLGWYKKQSVAVKPHWAAENPLKKKQKKLYNSEGEEVWPYNHPTIPPWDEDAPPNKVKTKKAE